MLNLLSVIIIMEEWKDIQGYEGLYQCSSFGNIRSLDRYVYEKTGKKQFRKGKIIIPRLNKNGYMQLALNKDGKRKMVYIHIITAKTFLNNPNNYETVNHIDGNKNNNKSNNLEWCSFSDNNKHAYTKLHRKKSTAGGSPIGVYVIDTELKQMRFYNSITDTHLNMGLSHTQINRYIHSNKKWKGRYFFLTDNNKCVEDNERVS